MAQEQARPRFVEIDPPDDDEVRALLDEIIERVTALVRPRFSDGDGTDTDTIDPDDTARQLQAFAARPLPRPPGALAPIPDDEPGPRCARKDAWSLHANVGIHRNDRVGLERLLRYCLRPALAPERLSGTEDGQILYGMKRKSSNGTQTIRLTPRELMMRLCALIPPPRSHLLRYFGVFCALRNQAEQRCKSSNNRVDN